MERRGKTLSSNFPLTDDEDQTSPYNSPPLTPAHTNHSRFNAARSTSASMMSPSPAGSPWSHSPLRHHRSPSLLYHCLATLQRTEGDVLSIAVSRGLIFTGSDSDRVRVWKSPECVDRGFIRTHHGGIRAIHAYGSTLFTAHRDNKARVWTVSAAPNRHLHYSKHATLPTSSILHLRRRRFPHHTDTVSCLAYYHPDGLLYTGSWDRSVKVWRLSERRCVDSFVAHEGRINALAVNEEDGSVFTASTDGSVKMWRRVFGDSAHVLITVLRFQPSPVNALALCRNGEAGCFVYSGSSDGSIIFWEKEELGGRYRHRGFLSGHQLAVLCLAGAERLVFSGSEDATIRVWRREEAGAAHVCLAVLEGHRGPVRCVAVAVEVEKAIGGLLLYSGSLDRLVKVWRIKSVTEERMTEAEELEFPVSPVLSPSWVERKMMANLHLY